jgi:dipeptidyl aminopeptidase/acylaminoacyl peptidase
LARTSIRCTIAGPMTPRHALVALLALSPLACGAESPPPPCPPSAPPPVVATTTATTAPAPPATAAGPTEPTALTAEQARRDAELAPRAAAVVDAYLNWNGFFSSLVARYAPDGKRFVFGSNRDGVQQIYLGDAAHPGEPAKAVTRGADRALDAEFTRDGRSILFLRDDKGNEQHAVWRVALDGGAPVNLTPGEPLQRSLPLLPRRKPRAMFYSGKRTSEAGFRVFEQSLDGGDARAVYTSTDPGGVADVTPDGKRLLVVTSRSPGDGTALEVDPASGKARRLYPAEGKTAAVHSLGYSADGARVLVSTDEGAESAVLLALDTRTGKEVARYTSTAPAAARLFAGASPAGGRVVVQVDAGNHGEVRILDARTLRVVREVKVPLGDVLVGDFREDGRAFALVVSLPEKPADVFEVNAETGDVRLLRDDKRAGLDSLGPIETTIETAKAFDGLAIPINRYLPKIEPGKRVPTIAIFHGGPSTSYAVRWNPYARFFVSLGYAVLEPNVRGSSGFGRAYEAADNREKRADWLRDLEAVNAWVKAQPWADPARVVVWGQSYGGYTTLMALTRQPALWSAGVDLYGPSNLRSLLLSTDAAIRAYLTAEFGDADTDRELLERYSPLKDVGAIVAPLFVYQGQNDPRVPRAEGDAIVAALRARRVPVEYMVAANEGHTVDHRENKIELLARTARFLEEHTR